MRTLLRSDDDAPGRGRPSLQLRRALASALIRIDTSNGEALQLGELCRKAGVSERTMCEAFHTTFGMSPSQYIRMRRLNLVRAALCIAHPKQATVAAVGKRYGFRDLGRMAAEYRALFGEYPSQTLRNIEP